MGLTLLLRSMPTFSTWYEQDTGTLFSRIPPPESVVATVWVPPLSPYSAERVNIYTYNARWLALLALDRLTNAELELATLSLPEAGHEALTPAAVRRKPDLYGSWAIALLELVLLYRLHLELAHLELAERPPALRHDRDSEGKLFGVGETAREHSPTMFHRIFRRLNAHQSRRVTVAGSGLDPRVEGTFDDCAGVLDDFLKNACKINVARNQAVHTAWLASIRILAKGVLQFMATQVLSLIRTRALRRHFAE